jgi:succinate dehydrogenase/fumarate reductase flavoprotein subunit
MTEEKEAPKRISRKDFVKGAAAVAGVGALASCAPAATPAPAGTAAPCPTCPPAEECPESPPCAAVGLPEQWDEEADVVVVGFGGAGAAAAISACDAGAKVLILEKAPEEFAGGNTGVAGGDVYARQDVDNAIAYLTALNGSYEVPAEHIEAWANKIAENLDFMTYMGVENPWWKPWEEFPELPGVVGSGSYFVGEMQRGLRLFDVYKSNVVERDIDVWYEAPGKELIQHPETKEILGVVAEKGGSEVYIKANRAVVLTLGGYENNPEMQRDYIHVPFIYPRGTPYNTGDGIKMALKVNADLWHMANQAGLSLVLKAPEPEYIGVGAPPKTQNCIYIGKDNKRFMNENETSRHGKVLRGGDWVNYPTPLPVHAIWDENAMLTAGALGLSLEARQAAAESGNAMGWNNVRELYDWSADNSIEIERRWILQADTLANLATHMERDPVAVQETIDRYNALCAAGEDLDFGRQPTQLLPINQPPFYCMELVPQMLNTQGGPRRNKDAQVLDVDLEPLPRLYSAGEFGSMYGNWYNGGMNLGEAMAFGRIAGENAAAEEPWV